MAKIAIVIFLLMAFLLSDKGNGFPSAINTKSASQLEFSQKPETVTSPKKQHAREVFVDALSTTGVPGGIVWRVICDADTPQIQADLSSLQMDEKLNLIVSSFPQYRWQNEQGAINLILQSGYPALLQTKLSDYQVDSAPSATVALGVLLNLPEFKEATSRLGLKNAISFLGLSSPRKRNISLSLKNVTVYDALNAIARAHGKAIWNYTEWECNGQKEYSIKFLLQ
ncbi:MAG: hypothetical protein L0287_38325 [Anaerolineae bacterium]|nr:hypothetical protein [Anaerolineae bacterium]